MHDPTASSNHGDVHQVELRCMANQTNVQAAADLPPMRSSPPIAFASLQDCSTIDVSFHKESMLCSVSQRQRSPAFT